MSNSPRASLASSPNPSILSVEPPSFETYSAQKKAKLRDDSRELNETPVGINPSELLSYASKRGSELVINNQFSDKEGEAIVCRHLAYEYLALDSEGNNPHLSFASEENIKGLPRLQDNMFDQNRVFHRADEYYLVPTEIPQALGQTLQAICADLELNKKKSLLLSSENHVMSLIIKKKSKPEAGGEYYSVKFFDPNYGDVHRRVVTKELENLAKLNFDSLMSAEEAALNSPKMKVCTLALYNDPVNLAPEKKEGREFVVIPALKEALEASYGFINQCCELGFTRQLNEFLEVVAEMSKEEKLKILSSRNDFEKTVFSQALLSNNLGLIKDFMSFVFDQKDLTLEEKKALIGGKVTENHDALFLVLQDGFSEVLDGYVAILKEKSPALIDTSEKRLQIFDPRDSSDGQSGLAIAAYKGNSSIIQNYLSLIAEDEVLSSAHKFEILLAKMKDGTTGLNFAFQEGHIESMKVYVQSLPRFSSLTEDQKIQLLEARGADINGQAGALGLKEALKNDKVDFVKAYATEVLALPEGFLSLEKKLALISPVFASQLLEISKKIGSEDFKNLVENFCVQAPQDQFKTLLSQGCRDFHGCNLSGCDFSGCDLTACNFVGANLESVKFDAYTTLTKAKFIDADHSFAKLDLASINQLLSNKTISECHFISAKLMTDFIREYNADRTWGVFRSENFAKSLEKAPEKAMASLVLMQHYEAHRSDKSKIRTVKIMDDLLLKKNPDSPGAE